MATPLTRVDGVRLLRGGVAVLDGVDLVVAPGERWALLGANGSGKTSLLSLLGARAHPTSGSVTVLGQPLGRVDVRDLWPRIAHVRGRQRPAAGLTLRQVVTTGLTGTDALALRWAPDAEGAARVETALASVGLLALGDRRFAALSDGEQRRTLLARALVREPDLLLLDEPAAGLDLPSREALVDALDALADVRPDLPWVLVSHHVEELPSATTHAALLRDGRVTAAGPAEDVLADAPLSACLGLAVRVRRTGGRWSVGRATRPGGVAGREGGIPAG